MEKYKPDHLKKCEALSLKLDNSINSSQILPVDMKMTEYSLKGQVGL